MSPVFLIPDHLQHFVYQGTHPFCNVIDPHMCQSSSASVACDDTLFYDVSFPHKVSRVQLFSLHQHTSYLSTANFYLYFIMSLLCLASHGIRITCLYPRVSNTSHCFHSSFHYVHASCPYVASGHTNALSGCILIGFVMELLFRMTVKLDSIFFRSEYSSQILRFYSVSFVYCDLWRWFPSALFGQIFLCNVHKIQIV